MNTNKIRISGSMAAVLAVTAALGFAAASCNEKKDVSQQSSESSVTTNDNGSVSRTFTEMTVSTNGNLVTEHRRETRTTTDAEGNMLASTTSEYAQSYPVGEEGIASLATKPAGAGVNAAEVDNTAFMGLKFGEEFKGTNFVADADEPTLLRATYTPKKPLGGFDDYYVYVTPKTHKVVKVYACAKEAIDPGTSWRRHYLIEALEKRYQTWARLCSFWRPYYAFDVAPDRYVTVCLTGATESYETVVAAWDEGVLRKAGDEYEQLREEARKNAAARRNKKVDAAADAF